AKSCPNRQRDAAVDFLLETRERSRYFIRPRRNIGNNEASGLVRECCPLRSGLHAFGGHRHTWNHRSLCVMDCAHDSARDRLSNRSWRVEETNNSRKNGNEKNKSLIVTHVVLLLAVAAVYFLRLRANALEVRGPLWVR